MTCGWLAGCAGVAGTGRCQQLKLPYSSRRIRRAAHEALTKRALKTYHPIQTKEATILVSSLLSSSAGTHPEKHFQRFTTSTIMSILYDHPTIVSEHDPTVERIDEYNNRFGRAVALGSNLVDIFPWMIHIPDRSWLRLVTVSHCVY